ncbi:MAG: stage II sporulation protein M [Gemmatimonadota bacterium]|nr:stage II sporulation protein M [Gemmatimonadota bacterium]
MMNSETYVVPGLDIFVEVETPEQVSLSYSVAGIGSRGAAAALDALICLGILIAGGAIMLIAASYSGVKTAQRMPMSGAWLMAFWIIVQFVITWGYYVLFEGIWDGQTPGKRLMKLRVVRDGGFSVTFGASAVRNLLRVVDAFGVYLVAIIVAMTNRSRKRLGDIVAGTFVIREERQQAVRSQPPGKSRDSRTTFARLSDEEYTVLERFMGRRLTLDPARRDAIVTQLSARVSDFLPSQTQSTRSADLLRLYETERDARANGVASRSDTGAQREQHAIAASGLKRWNDFSAALDSAYERGLSRMPASEVSALVAQYREIATDMARLQTASRGRENDSLFHVSRLVARGHNLLYRQKGRTLASIVTYIMEAVPTEVRRSWRPIALAALLLFGPAIAAYVVIVRDPQVAGQLLPDEMISRATEAKARQQRGEGYVTIPDEMRPVAASSIISNNVKITYLAFAMGVTFGIGTVFMLVFNGVAIGSSVGLFASQGVVRLILAFIAPHGVLELSAICIAGGGGLLLAAAIVLPGDRTRRDALVENGRRAINLIAASTLFLLVAGSLEGLVSPRVWPLEWKLWISGATAVLMLGYLSLGWRNSGKEKVVGGEARPPDDPVPAV